MDDIIQFPMTDEIRDRVADQFETHLADDGVVWGEKSKEAYIRRICDEIFEPAVEVMEKHGIPVESLQFQKDFRIVIEAMKGTLTRCVSLKHFLHPLMDQLIELGFEEPK